MATLLHQLLQRSGVRPEEVLSMPPGRRAFYLASMICQLEAEAEAEREALERVKQRGSR